MVTAGGIVRLVAVVGMGTALDRELVETGGIDASC
jgi:hypothetical protein